MPPGSRLLLLLLLSSLNAGLAANIDYFIAEKMDLGWFNTVVTHESISRRMHCIVFLALEMKRNTSFNAARYSADKGMCWIGNVDTTLNKSGDEDTIYMTLEGKRMAGETPPPDPTIPSG